MQENNTSIHIRVHSKRYREKDPERIKKITEQEAKIEKKKLLKMSNERLRFLENVSKRYKIKYSKHEAGSHSIELSPQDGHNKSALIM